MMVYSSLQAEFMVTKYDGHIHRYGALVFGKLVIYVSKSMEGGKKNCKQRLDIIIHYIQHPVIH